ncbi:MAG: hypothetical protein LLG00_16125 [Planctomycetaceae bacterium]|nr:hypothetical protein [Planctomycetaceae bacterium]
MLSELVASGHEEITEIGSPPRGAWFRTGIDGWELGASTRHPIAFFLVPFLCVWSGFSLGGIYGSQIVKGEFNLGTSLFGIPFVIGTVFLGSAAVMAVVGRLVVTVVADDGTVFVGVGPVGWRRRFRWDEMERVEEEDSTTRSSGSSGRVIALIGKTKLRFGSMLTDSRRYFFIQVLRKMLQGTRKKAL